MLEVGRWYFGELQRDPRHLLLRFRSYGETFDPEVSARVRAHFLKVFGFVKRLMEGARAAGQIDPATDTTSHTWLFMAIGALLDTTQILGLRDSLRLTEMIPLMRIASPKHGPNWRRKKKRTK